MYRNKQSDSAKNKIKEHASNVEDIFHIAHQDALAMMKSEEDKEFLLKQREKGRPGYMLVVDLKFSQAEEGKQKKERAKINQQIFLVRVSEIDTEDSRIINPKF